MSLLARFQTISDNDKTRAIRTLVEDATPDFDFFFLIILSVLMATFGLLAGSETVVVGSMLIAPILYPVLGLALGISMSDPQLIRRSLVTIGKAVALGALAGMLASIFFAFGGVGQGAMDEIVIVRTSPSLLFLAVGIIAGLAISYALVRPGLSETLPGVAVSVALIPPLAVVGIGIASVDLSMVIGALMMFLVNVTGIIAAAMLAFSLMDVHGKRHVAEETIEREEARVEQENRAVEEVRDETSPASAEVQ